MTGCEVASERLACLAWYSKSLPSVRCTSCGRGVLRLLRASVFTLFARPWQIINKPTGSKIAMLKAEVDILTRCDHPNMCACSCCCCRRCLRACSAAVLSMWHHVCSSPSRPPRGPSAAAVRALPRLLPA